MGGQSLAAPVVGSGQQSFALLSLTMSSHSYKSTYQKLLMEHWSPGIHSDPRRQFDWRLEEDFAADKFPHRSCIGRAGIPNVNGLVRSEMMIVTGMMISALRERGNEGLVIVPVGLALLYDHSSQQTS
jgi:hypothetical protein